MKKPYTRLANGMFWCCNREFKPVAIGGHYSNVHLGKGVTEHNKLVQSGLKKGTNHYIKGTAKPVSEETRLKLSLINIKKYQDPQERSKLRSLAYKQGFGGIRKGAGRGKKGSYKGIWCDSSWELAWVAFHSEQRTPFERCREKFPYVWQGKTYNYYPDFKVFGYFYVEVKGFKSERWECKREQFPYPDRLIVLYYDDLKLILDTCIQRYGCKFYDYLYDTYHDLPE